MSFNIKDFFDKKNNNHKVNVLEHMGINGLSSVGETCSANSDCRDFQGASVGECNVKCCNGTCEQLHRDYVGLYYCPAECKKGLFAATGTCDQLDQATCTFQEGFTSFE